MVAIREPTFPLEPGAQSPVAALRRRDAPADVASNLGETGDSVTFYFEEPAPDSGESRLTAAQRHAFRADIQCELAALQDWFAHWHWPPDGPFELRVVVSNRFRISKSLVPAWSGQRGLMEFSLWRVADGKAAIAHELTHVCFPNANRLLAEGLAVYVQAEMGRNPAFPNFGEPLHELAREILHDIARKALGDGPSNLESQARLCLADLDTIATPSPLTLKSGINFHGEEPQGQRVVYAIAGSFVAFLVATRGVDQFRELYQRTPFMPGSCDAGASGRWQDVYGLSLAYLEVEWRGMIANCDGAAPDAITRESCNA